VHLQRALELYEGQGLTHPAARVSARLGEVEWRAGQLEQALNRMERAFEVLSGDEADNDLATLAAELGRLHFFGGDLELAAERIDTAIEIAESLWFPEVLSQALNTQGLIASWKGRSQQSLALFKHALEVALEHDLAGAALRAYNNLGDRLDRSDRYEEAIDLHRRGLALARQAGDRIHEWRLLGELGWCLYRSGDWAEAVELASQVPGEQLALSLSAAGALTEIAVARGDAEEARRLLSLLSSLEVSGDVQDRATYLNARAAVDALEGKHAEALAHSEEALETSKLLGQGVSVDTKIAVDRALDVALSLGRLERVEELVAWIDAIPPGKRPPSLGAQAARSRARLAAERGEHERVEQGFKTAAAAFREHGLPFQLAVALLEHGEFLAAQGRRDEAEPLLVEAREIFERLEAPPWLERLDAVHVGGRAEIPA
jgi:tetratricopeptide (TPR) repeat protein